MIEKIGRVTSKSVEKHTGKSWDQWVRILNGIHGPHKTHKELVAFLKTKYRLTVWWQQVVATQYEIYIGKKVEGRSEKGFWAATVTKSISVSAKTMWDFLKSKQGIAIWLNPMDEFLFVKGQQYEVSGGIFGDIRTIQAPKRLRLRWQDSDWERHTVLQINVVPRENGKCILVFQHEELPSSRLKEQLRLHWRQVIEDLAKAVIS